MREAAASDYFAARVAEYDSLIRRGHPCYREMLDGLRAVLPDGVGYVLELGSGTGSLTMLLGERYPDARLTVVDGAAEMVDLTRARLEDAHPDTAARARFVTFDVRADGPGKQEI